MGLGVGKAMEEWVVLRCFRGRASGLRDLGSENQARCRSGSLGFSLGFRVSWGGSGVLVVNMDLSGISLNREY